LAVWLAISAVLLADVLDPICPDAAEDVDTGGTVADAVVGVVVVIIAVGFVADASDGTTAYFDFGAGVSQTRLTLQSYQ
jgi:hypothetical protein